MVHLPVGDIRAQNLRMKNGESKPAGIKRHVHAWIKTHPKTFDGWPQQARAAARK